MRVQIKVFRATFKSWQSLFNEAADFASALPHDRLINISHSADPGGEGVVSVWYWGEAGTCHSCGYDLRANTSQRCPECGTPA